MTCLTTWFVHCYHTHWYYVVNFYILIYNYGTIQAMHTDKLGVAWGRGYGCGVKLNFGTKILSPT